MLVITGTLGAGKLVIADEIHEQLCSADFNHAVIDFDTSGHFGPEPIPLASRTYETCGGTTLRPGPIISFSPRRCDRASISGASQPAFPTPSFPCACCKRRPRPWRPEYVLGT